VLRLRPQQVYAWRRLVRSGALALPAEKALGFVPVVAESEPAPTAVPTPAGIVEIEIAGAVIHAAPGVDWRHLREVLRAAALALLVERDELLRRAERMRHIIRQLGQASEHRSTQQSQPTMATILPIARISEHIRTRLGYPARDRTATRHRT
jgi:transposase-like protein